MRLKELVKRKIGKVLILSGCSLLIVVVGIRSYTRFEEKKLIQKYKQSITTLQDENQQENNEEPSEIQKERTGQSENTASSSIPSGQLMGILTIPKIDLSVAIKQGTEDTAMRYSVGHFEETAMPGQAGNSCFIGHRSYAFGEYFNRLNEVEAGDEIQIQSDRKLYTYQVTKTFVVDPEDLWVLDQGKSKTITLITCTPIRIATHRLIVQGELVSEESIS